MYTLSCLRGFFRCGSRIASTRAACLFPHSASKAEALVARGAARVASVADAVAASRLVVTCLLVYDTVYEALDPARHALSGRTLVNLTNGTPAQARAMAEWTARHGADYVDGGIMAVPPMIGQPEALILYSGSQKAFETHEKALGALGTAKYLGNDAGLAPLYDISLLSGMYGLFSGAIHATALVSSEEVPAREFMPMLIEWLSTMMGALPSLAEQVDTGDYTRNVVSNLGMQEAAYVNFIDASRAQGISPELIGPMGQLMKRGVVAGYGKADLSSLVELLKVPAVSKRTTG